MSCYVKIELSKHFECLLSKVTLIQISLKFVFPQTKKKALLFNFFLSTLIQKKRIMRGECGVEKKWEKLPCKKSKNSHL